MCWILWDKDILYGNPYHLWVMREYGVEKSWSSLFILEADVGSLIPCFPRLVGILENGDIVITVREEEHPTRKVSTRIVHYNPQSWPTIEVGLLDFDQEPVACYGQSLLCFDNLIKLANKIKNKTDISQMLMNT